MLKKKAQMSSFSQKRAHKSGPLKKVLKRGDTQKSETLKIVWWTLSVFLNTQKSAFESKLRREEREEQNERRAAADAEAEAELQRQRQEEFDARVERAVQERERRRQEDMATSPERRRRRRRGGLLANEEEGEVEERLGRGEQEVLLRRMVEVENLAQAQNPPVLLDPAALAVVRAPTARVEELNAPGPARLSRQRIKCPVAGCPITRSSQEALNVHIDNSHD